jgi:cytidine deaminase
MINLFWSNFMDINNLIRTAIDAAEKSYSPYSKFRVGASLLTKDGRIFTGTNVENRSYGGTICAERTAVVKAVSEGYRDFEAICIIGLDTGQILPPCGMCRQFISEFGSDIKVIMSNNKSEYEIVEMKNLLPYDSLFDLKNN